MYRASVGRFIALASSPSLMARFVLKSLIRVSSCLSSTSLSRTYLNGKSAPFAMSRGVLAYRSMSNQSGKAQPMELDQESVGEAEILGLRKLEDVIHSVRVKRSAPDWLPFVPGSSYWVPPRRRPRGIDELLSRLENRRIR